MQFTDIYAGATTQVSTWFGVEQSAEFFNLHGVWISGLLGLFFGVFIAAHYARKVALRAVNEQRKQALLLEENNVKGFLQALLVESKIVLELYHRKIGQPVENLVEGEFAHYSYSQTGDYFCVYNNNTHMLGRVTNSALRLQIVKANTLFKGVINSLQEHNTLYFEYLELLNIANSSLKPIDEGRVKRQSAKIKTHALTLKKEHVLMWMQMQQMIDMLRVERKNSQ